jgi:hypothetical protein
VTNGVKIALAVTGVLVLLGGGEALYIRHRNTADLNTPAAQADTGERALTDDETVAYSVKHMRPSSMKDMHDLDGKTVWISGGGQMDYYKDTSNHVNWSNSLGTLNGAEELKVKTVFEQTAPPAGKAQFRLGPAQKYVMLAFTLPKEADSTTLYAFPIGVYKSDGYTFYADQVLFYDDPHVLYKHWGPQMWSVVDKHQAVLGMTENQAMMSMGQTITPHGDKIGDRTVTYDNNGHPIDIDFVNGKAVKITPGK